MIRYYDSEENVIATYKTKPERDFSKIEKYYIDEETGKKVENKSYVESEAKEMKKEISYQANLFKSLNSRKKEYPPVEEAIDAMVNWMQQSILEGAKLPKDVLDYVEKCKAVKEKYPKPKRNKGR